MPIPYCQALHEDYVCSCLALLIRARLESRGTVDSARPNSMHELFERSTIASFPPTLLERFHLWRVSNDCPRCPDRHIDAEGIAF